MAKDLRIKIENWKLEIGNWRFSKLKRQGGFTLIEVMIAVTIFTIAVTIGTAAVLNTNAVYRKASATRALLDNLSFVMEDMTRNLRLGEKFTCPLASPPIGSDCNNKISISFNDVNRNETGYFIDENPQTSSATSLKYSIFKNVFQDGSMQNFLVSSPEINIDIHKSGFSVTGTEAGGDQPMVKIRLNGFIEIKDEQIEFNLQTSVSQRLLE